MAGSDSERDAALARVIAIVNDKGGVGKTSIAANLGGQCAGPDTAVCSSTSTGRRTWPTTSAIADRPVTTRVRVSSHR